MGKTDHLRHPQFIIRRPFAQGDWVLINILYITHPLVLQVLMQVLYLIILRSIKETNRFVSLILARREKTEFKVNQSQQTTDKLAYREIVTYARIDLNFHYSPQRCTHDQFIAGLGVFNVASLSREYRKGACL